MSTSELVLGFKKEKRKLEEIRGARVGGERKRGVEVVGDKTTIRE